MAGRKTKYTPEIRQQIINALSGGATQKDAAGFVGIDEDTLGNWKKRYSDFSDDIRKAQAQARIGAIARISKAGRDGNWTADAWFLERSDPANWGRKDKLTLEYGLTPDQLNRIARMLAEAGEASPGDTLEKLAQAYAQSATADTGSGEAGSTGD